MKNTELVKKVINFMNNQKTEELLKLNNNIDNIIIFLIDGLTYNQGKYLNQTLNGDLIKINADIPATTSTCYTKLLTLEDPTAFGIFGRITYNPVIKEPIHVFMYSNLDLQPINLRNYFFPIKNIKTIFEKNNWNNYLLILNRYGQSKYNKTFNKGAKIISYRNISEIPIIINEIVKEKNNFIWIYVNDIDTINHIFGSESLQAKTHLKLIGEIINMIEKNDNLRIMIFSDHGHAKVEKGKVINISWILEEYKKNETILPLAIEEKYLIIKGNIDRLLTELEDKKVKYIHTILDKQNVKKWFGEYHEGVQFILGSNFVLIDDYGYFTEFETDVEKPPAGVHSGITKEELEIPLIIL